MPLIGAQHGQQCCCKGQSPFNRQAQPLAINDPVVQRLQETTKQVSVGKKIETTRGHPPPAQCKRRAAYVGTIGTNMHLHHPDDACVFLWQPGQLNRVWVTPSYKCGWGEFDHPRQWHAMFIGHQGRRTSTCHILPPTRRTSKHESGKQQRFLLK